MPDFRPFYMGMTPHPYDFTPEAYADTYRILDRHADLIAHHLDEGVPWEASLAGTAFDANVEKDLETRVRGTGPGKRVFLSVTPISIERNGLAGAWGRDSHMPRPARFSALAFDDPMVVKAYLGYCRRMIARFKPTYMAYAIEVNDLAKGAAATYRAFLNLSREVYTTLKREFPALPLFPTFVLGNAAGFDERQRQMMRDLAPYTDIVAVSTYPYVWDGVGGDPKRMGPAWFESVARFLPGKPFAVAETGFIAETFVLARHLVFIRSSEAAQAEYVRILLSEANRLRAEFVVWYVPVDYDRLWKIMRANGASPWFEQWRTSGLIDAKMRPRKGMTEWQSWLKLPRK